MSVRRSHQAERSLALLDELIGKYPDSPARGNGARRTPARARRSRGDGKARARGGGLPRAVPGRIREARSATASREGEGQALSVLGDIRLLPMPRRRRAPTSRAVKYGPRRPEPTPNRPNQTPQMKVLPSRELLPRRLRGRPLVSMARRCACRHRPSRRPRAIPNRSRPRKPLLHSRVRRPVSTRAPLAACETTLRPLPHGTLHRSPCAMPRWSAVSCKDCETRCTANATNYTNVCLEGWRSIRRRLRLPSRDQLHVEERQVWIIERRCPVCWRAYMERGGYTMTRSLRRRPAEPEHTPAQ